MRYFSLNELAIYLKTSETKGDQIKYGRYRAQKDG